MRSVFNMTNIPFATGVNQEEKYVAGIYCKAYRRISACS